MESLKSSKKACKNHLAPALQRVSLETSVLENKIMTTNKIFKQTVTLVGFAALASLTTACGSTYTQLAKPQTVLATGGNGTTGTTTPIITNPAVPVIPFTPTYTSSFVMSGTGGTLPGAAITDIFTDTIFKVRVTAGSASNLALPAGTNGGYSNFSASYSCVSYTIEALGQTRTTVPLSVSGSSTMNLCKNSPSEQVFDFSSRLTPGHGPVSVTIKSAKYDYYCQLLLMGYIYNGYYNTYCSASLYPVYKTHTVTGNLDIQVNGS